MTETPKSPEPRAKKKAPEPIPGMITPEAPRRAGSTPPMPPMPPVPPAPQAPPAPPVPPAPQTPVTPGPRPQPAPGLMLESTARSLAMWAHLSSLLTWIISIPGIAGALTFWLIGKDKSALVDHNGKEAVNFQLTVLVVLLGGTALGFITCGLGFFIVGPLWLIGAVFALIWQIQGAIAANNGEYYRYPWSWRMVH